MVAREENITKAANLLHVTQPTLSRQLRQLEEELGVKLFHRGGHRVTLTEEGMLLRRRAGEIVALAEKTRLDLGSREGELAGEISIGSGELQSSQLLSKIVASFRARCPLVHFEFYSGNSDNIRERIEGGVLDLGLLVEPVELTKYDFLRMPVREEWGILVSEDSKLAGKACVRPEDLVHIPLMMTRRRALQTELVNWFGDFSDQIQVVASGNLLYNLAILARNGVGTVLTIKLDSAFEGLRYVPLSPRLESGTVLVWKKDQPFSAAASAFLRHAKEYISGISQHVE